MVKRFKTLREMPIAALERERQKHLQAGDDDMATYIAEIIDQKESVRTKNRLI